MAKKCRKCKEPMGMMELFNGTKLGYQCINPSCPRYGLPEHIPTPKSIATTKTDKEE